MKSSSATFHAETSDRAQADAVLTVLWDAQNNHGCAPNQIYHPLNASVTHSVTSGVRGLSLSRKSLQHTTH